MIRKSTFHTLFFSFILASLGGTLHAETTSIIVELSRPPAAVAAAEARSAGTPMSADEIEAYRSSLAADQDALLAELTANGIPFELGGVTLEDSSGHPVRVSFAYTLVYNGINLKVPADTVGAILTMPRVKAVHPDEMLFTSLDASVPYVRAPEVYGAVPELTAFDDLREGFEGQGIYISVIDTGIDWTHEMFGGDPSPPRLGVEPSVAALGRNEKVVYYLPFADLGVADGFGHGTHVAATAAGYRGFTPGADGIPLTGDDIPIHGVAPQAKLLSYKVCSDVISTVDQVQPVGGCFSAAIAMAIEDSVSPRTVNGFPKPVAHIINMSLGGSGSPDSPTAVASDNASKLGTMVVAAAGNSGANGEGTVGAPCVGRLVACVGNSIDPSGSWSTDILEPSSVNRLTPGSVTPATGLPEAPGQRSGIRVFPMSGSASPPKGSMAQYYVFVQDGALLTGWPASVQGRIAIVQTGLPATFAQVANNGAAAGAIAVIFRSNTSNPTAVRAPIPAMNMPLADFDYLKSLMGTGAPANGALSTFPIRINPFFGVTSMNDTSSRGPVAGFGQVKPDLTAPGTQIVAAVPPASLLGALSQGNYGSISGTSMASPHVAGAAALVKQSHPGWSPDMIRTALMNTSTNLRDQNGVAKADTTTGERVLDQGSGLIDVYEAVNIKALMGVTSTDPKLPSIYGAHSFGAVPSINAQGIVTRSTTVAIRDVSGSPGEYSLALIDNRGLNTPGVSVFVSPETVPVAAGGSGTFTVTVSIDGGVITEGAPLQLQWYVQATRDDGAETLRMPFYLRATQTLPSAAVLHPIADDADPDQQDGVDRDGRYVLSWSYSEEDPARPCGFRVEEAIVSSAGSIFYDDAEEVMLDGENSTWTGSTEWASRPHPVSLSLGYAPLYLNELETSITTRVPITFPAGSLVTLTFHSFEDIEPDFDYGIVEVSTDGGGSFQEVARYTGLFLGERTVDLSSFAGTDTHLRFRFSTDEFVAAPEYQGWTIDDVRIRATSGFSPIGTTDHDRTSFEVSGRTDNTYSYRIVALFGDCAASPIETTPSNIEQIAVSLATAPPTALFDAAPNPSLPGETVSFDASASHDNDSVGGSPGISRYDWSFGDGATESTTSPTTSHAYSTTGSYRVALTVIDDDGESASTETLQTVREPNASISGGGFITTDDGKSNFGLDIVMTSGVADGSVRYHDHGRKIRLQSSSITRVERSANFARIEGLATINKAGSSSFVVEVTDNGEGSTDVFSIQFDDYSASNTLGGGNVIVE